MVSVDLCSRQFSFSTCLILFVFLLLCDIQIKSNQIKSSLPIYLVKCHPSIELLRVKWEENYLRSYVVAVGKEWQCLLQLSWDQAPPPFPLPRLHLSARFARRFYFPFPFNAEPGPGLFCNYLHGGVRNRFNSAKQ